MSLSKIHLHVPPKSTGYTQDAVAPSRHDWKIVYWDAKQKKKKTLARTPGFGPSVFSSFFSEYWENIPHKILFWIARHK